MNHPPLAEPIWVDTPAVFDNMLADISRQSQLAVDTESNSLYVFHEQVCLIQFSTEKQDYLVDTLAGLELSVLESIFIDVDIEKIFHAVEYDIVCLKRDFNFQFANLFDTMQAARILGWKQLGLSSMLASQFGVRVNKRYQKANWGKRPLPPEMRDYARLDTHYLIPLRQRLLAALREAKRHDLAQEDFRRLTQVQSKPNHRPACTCIKGYNHLTQRQLAVLQELCAYRERKARVANLPPFKIIGNPTLLELAQTCPQTHEQLAALKKLSHKLYKRHAQGLLDAVRCGLDMPFIKSKHRPRPSNVYIDRLERLKDWRKQAARRMGVQSDVILPRDVLDLIAKKNPRSQAELQALMQDLPARFTRFGEQVLAIL